jgi:Protein of unknown function (DUF3568)
MKKRLLTIGMATALLAMVSGCVIVAVSAIAVAGAGGWQWYKGEIKATEQAPLDKCWNATLAAMKDMEYPVTYKAKDALAAELKAVNSGGTTIHIDLKKLDNNSTEIGIRVGTFGDEPLSRTIIGKIEDHIVAK